jgi:hypothetical protein
MEDDIKTRFDSILQLIAERDRLYSERAVKQDKAVELALAAVEKQTMLSLEAQREVAHKAEQAQHEYNITHNDLIRRMDKQYEETVSRREYLPAHEDLRREISTLREARVEYQGANEAKAAFTNNIKWVIGLLVVLLGGLMYQFLKHL